MPDAKVTDVAHARAGFPHGGPVFPYDHHATLRYGETPSQYLEARACIFRSVRMTSTPLFVLPVAESVHDRAGPIVHERGEQPARAQQSL